MFTPTPQPASTIVLCKITTEWPYKILLIKRSAKAAFLPGAHVFPGGRVEPEDHQFGKLLAGDTHNAERLQRAFNLDMGTVLAHVSAAIRETFEEVGISWLKETGDQPPDLSNLWPISWWVTPPGETRRFDTWFFLGLIEDHMLETSALHSQEATSQAWLTAPEALALYNSGEIFLAPPTRTILERMNLTKSLSDFLTFVDQPLLPIHPFFRDDQEQKMLILPGDPLHPEKRRSSLPPHTRYTFP